MFVLILLETCLFSATIVIFCFFYILSKLKKYSRRNGRNPHRSNRNARNRNDRNHDRNRNLKH